MKSVHFSSNQLLFGIIFPIFGGISFSSFLYSFYSLKTPLLFFVPILFPLFWIGFSFFLFRLRLTKGNLKNILKKTSPTYIAFFPLISIFLRPIIPLYNPNIWSAFLFILVLGVFIFLKARLIDWRLLRTRFPIKSGFLPLLCLGILIFLYIFIFTYLSFLRHTRLFTGMDLAGFNQAMWNTVHGRILSTTIYEHNFLGCHFAPLLILISPIYALWQDPKMLLFLQTLFLGLGAIPVYLISYHRLRDRFASLVFAFSYLAYPFLSRINLADFHEISLAPMFVLFSFLFLIKRRFLLYFIFIVLSLMAKEDVSFLICALGIYVFFKQNKKIGAITFILGLFWAILAIKIAIPFIGKATSVSGFTEWDSYSQRYLHLGKDPSEWVKTILSHPLAVSKTIIVPQKIITVVLLLLPLGFFSLLGIELLLICLPSLLLHLLGYFKLQHLLLWHNSALIIPFLTISAIYGFGRLTEKAKIKPATTLSLLLLSISFLYCLHFSEPPFLRGLSIDAEDYKPELQKRLLFIPEMTKEEEARLKLFYLLKLLIPRNAPIACGDPWAPHLSGRKMIFRFNEGRANFEGADYILLDYSWMFFSLEFTTPHIKKLEETGQFQKIFEETEGGGFVIYVRKQKEKDFLESAKALAERNPSAHTHFILSSIYSNLNMPEYAKREAERVVELSPDYYNPQIYIILGNASLILNLPDKAYFAYKRAVEKDPLKILELNRVKALYLKNGLSEKAEMVEKEMEKMILSLKERASKDPKNIYLKKQIAVILANKGRYREAVLYLEEILKEEPNDPWARQLFMQLKDFS
jgi:uncharacterized membrane protein